MMNRSLLIKCCCRHLWIFLMGLIIGLSASGYAQNSPEGFSEVLVVDGLSNPTSMVVTPDGRIFVTEQGGAIRVIEDYQLLDAPLLNLNVRAIAESGLVGMTLDPNFAENDYLYVYYTTAEEPVRNRLSRFIVQGNRAAAGSELVLMEFDPLNGATDHNGGGLRFGPDGKLYVGVGDSTYPPNSQLLYNRAGKILRLNADGSIPTDNPFISDGSVHPAIWAYGLRNPYSFAFENETDRMFINDVGNNDWEEINLGVAGANYGWPTTEGETDDPTLQGPLLAYPHEGEGLFGCAITSGAFYAPEMVQFPAEFLETYFFSDYCGNWIKRYDSAADSVVDFMTTSGALIVDLEVMNEGYLYYLAQASPAGSGALYRVDYTVGAPPVVIQHPAPLLLPAGEPAAFRCSATGEGPLLYQWQRDGVDIRGAVDSAFEIEAALVEDDGSMYRCAVSNALGSAVSREAALGVVPGARPGAAILEPAAGTLYAAGQEIAFAGAASDPDEERLPPQAYSWKVDFFQDRFSSPFMLPTSGIDSGSLLIPDTGQTATNVFYRVYLTVTDSTGLSTTTFVDVYPQVVLLTLQTDPPGLQLSFDGSTITTPFEINSVVGMQRRAGASTQNKDGVDYAFSAWLDGGEAERAIITPGQDTVYTAVFTPANAADTP